MFDVAFPLVDAGGAPVVPRPSPACEPDVIAGPAPASSLSNDDLHEAILTLAGHIAAAKCAWLDLLAEMDRREMYYEWGCRSGADWLSVRCGIGLGTAFEYLRVARAIDAHRLIHDAFSAGELSYCKVRAITRVVTTDNEATLLEYARYGTGAQLERIVGAFRGAKEAADPQLAERRIARRYLRYRYEADGSLTGSFRLPPDVGALLVVALQAAEASLDGEEKGRGNKESSSTTEEGGLQSPSPEEFSAEESGSAASPVPEFSAEESGGVTSPVAEFSAEESGGVTSPVAEFSAEESGGVTSPVAEFSAVVIHDDPEIASWRNALDPTGAKGLDALVHLCELALARVGEGDLVWPRPSLVIHLGGTEATVDHGPHLGIGTEATVDHGPHLGFDTARRLTCDSTVRVQTEQTQVPIDLGRTKRVVTPALRRALAARDGGCRWVGCHRKFFTHAHHIVHWADGGPTDLANLVNLCSWHHTQVHEGNCSVTRDATGKVVFSTPKAGVLADGCEQMAGSTSGLREWNLADQVAITPETCVPLGGGEPYDLSMAVDALMSYEPAKVRGY